MVRTLKKHEFAALLLWPILASVLSVLVHAEVYTSLLLFFGVPALYLSLRHPELVQKSAFFALIFSVPATFLTDYVMEVTRGWSIGRMGLPNVWILQHVSLLQIIWLALYTYLIVIYYEAFFDRSVRKIIYPRTSYLMALSLGLLGFVVLFHYLDEGRLHIQYFYLKIGFVAVLLPLLVVLYKRPLLYPKFLKVGTYFFFYNLLYELTALRLQQWSFPATD